MVIFYMRIFVKKPHIFKEEIVLIDRAEFVPIPEFVDTKKSINEVKVDEASGKKEIVSEAPVIRNNLETKNSKWEYKVPEKVDTSWREKISSLTTQKKKSIDNIKPIEISRSKDIEEEKKREKTEITNNISDEKEVLFYSKKIQAVIRNHWSVPEDIALKYGNKPVEVEIEIDITGGLKSYRLKNSSGNSIYDASIKEAIKKSFPFLPPPKNLFQTSFDSAKITIIFRL